MHGLHSSGLLALFRCLRFFGLESSRRKIRSSFVVVILSLLIGCSGDELTREKAAALLGPPQEITEDFWVIFSRNERVYGAQGKLNSRVEALTSLGLIDGVKTNIGPDLRFADPKQQILNQWILSENAKQYIRGQPRVESSGGSRVTVVERVERTGEVTGITFRGEPKSFAIVEYQVVSEMTPFGAIKKYDNGIWKAEKVTTETYSRTAQFQLYDDGWRLM